jgi:hypothetical protein
MSKSKSVERSNINAIRQALRREFGDRQYRITRDGEIHVYGPMTNAEHIIGWRLYGHVCDKQSLYDLGLGD